MFKHLDPMRLALKTRLQKIFFKSVDV